MGRRVNWDLGIGTLTPGADGTHMERALRRVADRVELVHEDRPRGNLGGAAWALRQSRHWEPGTRTICVHDAGLAMRTAPLLRNTSRGALPVAYTAAGPLSLVEAAALGHREAVKGALDRVDVLWGGQVVEVGGWEEPAADLPLVKWAAPWPDDDGADLGRIAWDADGRICGMVGAGGSPVVREASTAKYADLGSFVADARWLREDAPLFGDIHRDALWPWLSAGSLQAGVRVATGPWPWWAFRRASAWLRHSVALGGPQGARWRALLQVEEPLVDCVLGGVHIGAGKGPTFEEVANGVRVGGVFVKGSLLGRCRLDAGSSVVDSWLGDVTGQVSASRSRLLEVDGGMYTDVVVHGP